MIECSLLLPPDQNKQEQRNDININNKGRRLIRYLNIIITAGASKLIFQETEITRLKEISK